jgi:hypothetical protein
VINNICKPVMVSLNFLRRYKMSNHKDSLVKVLEYLVNEDREKAADLLHDVFVEKAKNHWSALSESDESVEDDIQDEDLDETYDVEVEESIDSYDAEEDFLNDIESADEEIEAEEVFGEDDDEGDMDIEVDMGDDEGEEEAPEPEEALANVEDAIAELRAAFADMMGDDSGEEADMDIDMDAEKEPEMEAFGEGAKLASVSVAHPEGNDSGAKSPIAKPQSGPTGAKAHPTDTTEQTSAKAPAAKSMNVKGPQEAGSPTPAPAPKREMK